MAYKHKTQHEYDDLFEKLMEYTDFKSTLEIENKQDLQKFFDQVDRHSNKKGIKSKFDGSPRLKKEAWNWITRKQGTIVVNPLAAKIATNKRYKDGLTARIAEAWVPSKDKKGNDIQVYPTTMKRKGKTITIWKDMLGRIAKKPEMKE